MNIKYPKSIILIPLLILACLPLAPAMAQVNYAVYGNAAYVVGSPNASGNIVIASTYLGYPVTSIGDFAFERCFGLFSVTIPNSVTNIKSHAFIYCTNLTSLTVGSGVTSLGLYAFHDCSSLTNVTIPTNVTSIGYGAFSGCTSLASVTIPASVTSIGPGVFGGCSSLTNVSVDATNPVYTSLQGVLFDKAQTTLIQFPGGRSGGYAIPNSVTNIEQEAFYSCSSMMSVIIPNSVTSIGLSAFANCSSLTSLTIPNSVTSIEGSAFYHCTSLKSVTIPGSVTEFEFGAGAFQDCTSLTSVTIEDGVTGIGGFTFFGCTSLTNITIPNSVTSIGDSAFIYCTSLAKVTIGNSVTIIEEEVFDNCANLTNLTFLGDAPFLGGDFNNVGVGATVYYYYGTAGWDQIYGGLPTVMIGAPVPQVSTASASVKPGGFGFTINGVTNQTIVIEASTNLVNWQSIWTNTLSTVSTNFVDPQWLNHPHRFYRLRSN